MIQILRRSGRIASSRVAISLGTRRWCSAVKLDAFRGLPFYTMPFVEGESLRARLRTSGALAPGPSAFVEDLHVHWPLALDAAQARDVVLEIGQLGRVQLGRHV